MSKTHSLVHQGIAELIGTFFLAMTVVVAVVGPTISVGYEALYTPLAIGLMVMILVYSFGHISGANFNPSVTVALFAFRKINVQQLATYLVMQVLGAWAGVIVGHRLIKGLPDVPNEVSTAAMLGEFFGALILVMVVTNVVIKRISAEISGLAIGVAIVVAATLSLGASGGIFNPAVALALGAHQITYLLMPLLGGLVGASIAIWLSKEKE